MRDMSDLNAKINLLLAMRMVSDAELARLTDASKQVADEAAQQIEETRDLKDQLERRDREIRGLRDALDRETTKLAALESSTSWKLTAPLRAGMTLVRRQRGDPANH